LPDEPIAARLDADDALTQAAECLERGDESAAVPHLRVYVKAHPDAIMVRAHLAELLFRAGRHAEARGQYDRTVADAQRATGPAKGHLVHCHTRLMAIAEATDDAFHEQLHRGIGLVLLVERWDADPERRDQVVAEQTLAKAVAALRAAKDARPTDPRANLYLGDALARLGQASAARAAYRAARAGLPDPEVTPAERERIERVGDSLRESPFR
jgi:tetratricopeptide (TPR) repeat protein